MCAIGGVWANDATPKSGFVPAFGSGIINTATSHGLALPVTAITTSGNESTVLAVVNDKVQRRTVATGLTARGLVEIKSGVAEGDSVIARAGSFLRDGDSVRAISGEAPPAPGAADAALNPPVAGHPANPGTVSEIE